MVAGDPHKVNTGYREMKSTSYDHHMYKQVLAVIEEQHYPVKEPTNAHDNFTMGKIN